MAMSRGDASAVKDKSLDKSTVRRVLGFARPYRGMIFAFITTIIIAAVLSLIPTLLFRTIIDDAIPNGDRGQVNVLAIFIILAAVAEAVLSFLQRWWQSRVGEGLIYDLRVSLFDHVQRMPIAFFTRTQTGSLISRLNNDVIGAQRALTGTLGGVISNVIMLTVTLFAMLRLEWRLTLLSLLVLPIFLLPTKRVGKTLQSLTREQMGHNAAMNNTMTERLNVAGAMVVKLFGRHDDERDEFGSRAGQVRDLGVRSALYGRAFTIALALVAAVGTTIIYWLGAQLVISGDITIGTLTALSIFVVRIYMPLTSLTNARVDTMTAFVSFERVFEVLDSPNPITDKPDAVALANPAGAIRFDDVWFSYSSDGGALASLEAGGGGHGHGGHGHGHGAPAAPANGTAKNGTAKNGTAKNGTEPVAPTVLKGIDLTIEPGQLVALVGPSGAGKTTLASLVTRLYDVDSGAVLVDGHDVRDVTLQSLRSHIGVVAQDPHLFHDTVRSNLRYARPGATDAEIEQACRSAQIYDVIAALPEGFDTVVGERGYRLSGGEKQRLSIARMLLKNPAIVVLDEATSHLDSENEALIQEALAATLQGRTSIVIAHRLSTITAADQIVVLNDGEVVETGRHSELLDNDGLYSELYTTLVRDQPVTAP